MRRHIYHVYTPFCRFQNLIAVTTRLKPENVQWHPIFDPRVPFEIKADWIHCSVCPNKEEGWFVGHWYQNWWIEHTDIADADRYIMISDDDLFQEGFFDQMDRNEGEVLVASMVRQCLGDTLNAEPGNMQCGRVGGEQVMVSGRILKQCRFGSSATGDWDFISQAIGKASPVYVPEAVVWWNYLDRTNFYPA